MPTTGHELRGPRLRLRPLRPKDARHLVAHLNEWDIVRQTAAIPYPYDLAAAKAFIAARLAEESPTFVIERGSDGAFMGCIALKETAGANTYECGYWVGKPFWGHGYASEALALLVDLAFGEIAAVALVATARTENAASHRVLEKLGFAVVGEGMGYSLANQAELPVVFRRLTRAAWEKRR